MYRPLKWLLYFLFAVLLLLVSILIIFRLKGYFRETKTRQEAAPKSGKFVKASDLELFVQEMGPADGKTVLFISGFAAWSETWKETMSALSQKGFHVVAVDLPPFGFSEKPSDFSYSKNTQAKRILCMLDSLKIGNAVLVGHSYGGKTTMETYFSSPQRFNGLVLVDVALELEKNPQQNNQIVSTLLSVKPIRNSLISLTLTNPLFTKYLLQSFIAKKEAATDSKVKIYQQPLVIKNSTNELGNWLQYDLYNPSERGLNNNSENYKKINSPTLLIWGEKDTVTPLPQADNLKNLIPNSKLATMSGIGHIPQIEDNDNFNKILLEFLNSQIK